MSNKGVQIKTDWRAKLNDHLPLAVAAQENSHVVEVKINSLIFEESPRSHGVDAQHAHVLADAGDQLPPIMVHRTTRRVIDGIHRIHAAVLNGRSTIRAHLVDCDDATAFVLSVRANVTHGLPLSSVDRKVAAARIITTHPHWSDRAVGVAVGLSYKTVARVRARSTGNLAQLNAVRVGRDGRLHPLNTAAKRLRAAAIINGNPDAGLREVARATGLSPSTVRDVRDRTHRGEDPVPARYRRAAAPTTENPSTPARKPAGRPVRRGVHINQDALLTKLRSDPSIRLNETRRSTLRWLYHHVVEGESAKAIAAAVPDHWSPTVAELAWSCADAWSRLAEELEQEAD